MTQLESAHEGFITPEMARVAPPAHGTPGIFHGSTLDGICAALEPGALR